LAPEAAKMDETLQRVPANPVQLMLWPHRSLSRRALWWFLALQSFAAGMFAGLAAWRGNVFAPAFAVLELGIVAFCLARVWRASGAGEVITLAGSRLEVARMGSAAPPAQFHPYWTQLILQPGRYYGWPSRLLLRSHGREVEIGAFLNEAERQELRSRLASLLTQAKTGLEYR